MASNLLVTGKWGEVHVTSAQQRNFNSGVVGDGQYVMNGLTATMSDSNTFHMDPGVACMNGADVEVPAGGVDVTVTNGTQGMLRRDLICMRYTMDGPTQKESVELVCVRGTPAATDPQDPEYNDGSILDESLVVDMPLYRVPLDGVSVGDPEPLFDVLIPMADLWDSVSQVEISDGWVVERLPSGYARLHAATTRYMVLDQQWGDYHVYGMWPRLTFPVAFAEPPVVTASCEAFGGCFPMPFQVTEATAEVRIMDIARDPESKDVTLHVSVFGRLA